jgi:AraC-like DNA-binding protein
VACPPSTTTHRRRSSERRKNLAALVGETPLAYLTRWRMNLAADRLHPEGASVAELARAVGYMSETAFAKAFRSTWGMSPSTYRAGVPVAKKEEQTPDHGQAHRPIQVELPSFAAASHRGQTSLQYF